MIVADASDAIRQNVTATADRSEINSLIVLEIKVVPPAFGENYFTLIWCPLSPYRPFRECSYNGLESKILRSESLLLGGSRNHEFGISARRNQRFYERSGSVSDILQRKKCSNMLRTRGVRVQRGFSLTIQWLQCCCAGERGRTISFTGIGLKIMMDIPLARRQAGSDGR
jgi:hypothetical protein